MYIEAKFSICDGLLECDCFVANFPNSFNFIKWNFKFFASFDCKHNELFLGDFFESFGVKGIDSNHHHIGANLVGRSKIFETNDGGIMRLNNIIKL